MRRDKVMSGSVELAVSILVALGAIAILITLVIGGLFVSMWCVGMLLKTFVMRGRK